eukprot:g12244.t1
MGVRKEGSGKSRSTAQYKNQNHGAPVSHASRVSGPTADNSTTNLERESDEDSDPELQEVYVQAYACQIFRDDAAAASVDDGAHLRPLAASQEPGAEPLMLDRFDARWMLDLPDFKKGMGSSLPAKLAAEERQADSLRYASLPSGDHSVVVQGLDQFAPSGSYAHGGKRGGLGDDEDDPEVYGYYGRTASPPPPPPSSTTFGSGAWAPTSAFQDSVENEQDGDEAASATPGGVGEGGEDGGAQPKAPSADGTEAFVPDFGVPEGVVIPATVRQHMMMVGTARTAVRSPQLEVLLRLKQQSNLAFSFLSDEDPVHSYYVFLKSWGEVALASEYARQQRLQAERAEARRREEEQRKEREEQAAAAAAAVAAAKAAKEATSPPLAPAEAGGSDESDAPNLLGGAYESSDDEEEPIPATPAGVPATGGAPSPQAAGVGQGVAAAGSGDRSETSPLVPVAPLAPDEEKRQVVEKMVGYVAKNGQAFEDRVRNRETSNPTFDFLVPTNQFHAYYKMRLALAKGDEPAVPAARTASSHASQSPPSTTVSPPAGVVANRTSEPQPQPASARAPPQREAEQSSGWVGPETSSNGAGSSATLVLPPPDSAAVEGSSGGTDAAGVSVSAGSSAGVAGDAGIVRGKLGAELGLALSRIDNREGKRKTSSPHDQAPNEPGSATSRAPNDGAAEEGRVAVVATADEESDRVVAAAAAAAVVPTSNPLTVEDAETRRANRLKRARLMTGHYKLAVMKHSSDQQEKETIPGDGDEAGAPAPGARPSSGGGGGGGDEGGDGISSADGLSDFDDSSDGDGSESEDDAGDGVDDAAGGKASGETTSAAVEGTRKSVASATGDRTRRSTGGGDARGSPTRKHKASGDSTRRRERRDEVDDRAGHRHGSGIQRKSKPSKQSYGSDTRRDRDREKSGADDSRGQGDDRRSSRKGRSRSKSRSRSLSRGRGNGDDRDGSKGDRDRGTRRSGSSRDRDRSSGGGSRSDARDRKDGGRGERSEGGRKQSSKSSSARKPDDGVRQGRVGDSKERSREQSRSDRRGGDSGARMRGNESRHEKERDKSSRRRSRSRDRGESRERGGSSKRSRRR